ncbi:MAG: hypothetical protein O2931_17765, partial [Planctomycetota bacterium]|nr:hypothetical protein [Planctomycetota bacterium]
LLSGGLRHRQGYAALRAIGMLLSHCCHFNKTAIFRKIYQLQRCVPVFGSLAYASGYKTSALPRDRFAFMGLESPSDGRSVLIRS